MRWDARSPRHTAHDLGSRPDAPCRATAPDTSVGCSRRKNRAGSRRDLISGGIRWPVVRRGLEVVTVRPTTYGAIFARVAGTGATGNGHHAQAGDHREVPAAFGLHGHLLLDLALHGTMINRNITGRLRLVFLACASVPARLRLVVGRPGLGLGCRSGLDGLGGLGHDHNSISARSPLTSGRPWRCLRRSGPVPSWACTAASTSPGAGSGAASSSSSKDMSDDEIGAGVNGSADIGHLAAVTPMGAPVSSSYSTVCPREADGFLEPS